VPAQDQLEGRLVTTANEAFEQFRVAGTWTLRSRQEAAHMAEDFLSRVHGQVLAIVSLGE
jgi:hypothetical protein